MLGVAGSQLYGTNLENGDNDQMGVAIEPPSHVIGLNEFEQWQHHGAGGGQRSQAGDLDCTVYSLRKWTRLAEQGNPTVLLLGFTPDHLLLHDTEYGREIRNTMWRFLSRQAASRFLGYLDSQRKQMLGLTGRRHSNRPELVEQYGFDTKFAYHAVRLGIQGVEFLTTGRMELPMKQEYRDYLIGIRQGKETKADVVDVIDQYADILRGLRHWDQLPPKPDREYLNRWLSNMYLNHWDEVGCG